MTQPEKRLNDILGEIDIIMGRRICTEINGKKWYRLSNEGSEIIHITSFNYKGICIVVEYAKSESEIDIAEDGDSFYLDDYTNDEDLINAILSEINNIE